MKQAMLITVLAVILGMVGWTAYDFLSEDKESEFEGALLVADPETQNGGGDTDSFGLEQGNMAPDFELETLEGEPVKLSDYRGQKVIVNFWATWCPPCREEIPDLKKLYNNEDVEILAVNMEKTEKSREHVEKFVYEDYEMPFPVLMDTTSEILTTYKVAAYPTSYMIDTEGNIQFMAMGAMTYDQMVEQLNKLD